ncbi:MAG: secretin N-terminal domain-containing protein [Pseudomonadota bacterium]
MKKIVWGLVLTIMLVPLAQSAEKMAPAGRADIELDTVLSGLHKRSSQIFLVHDTVPKLVSVGHIDSKAIDYPILLVILRNNNLAAVQMQGVVNIVPQGLIRQYALPIANTDDSAIADDEWVTRVVQVEHVSAAQLVPILRPLIPQAGHLAASGKTGNLILVSHYANVRRISALIAELDKKPVQ